MKKNNFWPVFAIVVLMGFAIFIWQSAKNQETKADAGFNNQLQAADEEKYFSDSAKVMFFYSEGCGWCEEEKKVLLEISNQGYKVKPISASEHKDLFDKYEVTGTPTLVAPDGEKKVGYLDKEELKSFLDKYK